MYFLIKQPTTSSMTHLNDWQIINLYRSTYHWVPKLIMSSYTWIIDESRKTLSKYILYSSKTLHLQFSHHLIVFFFSFSQLTDRTDCLGAFVFLSWTKNVMANQPNMTPSLFTESIHVFSLAWALNHIEQTDNLNVAQPANENMLIPCVLFTSVCVCS